MKPAILSWIFLCLLLTTSLADAKVFKNGYISYEMQDNWDCKLEITEWVCRATDPEEAKEALIVVTAKEKGPTDSFEIYTDHMNKSIENISKGGATLNSTVKYPTQEQKINNHRWLDSLHQDSEIANYFTRYLATINGEIAILVTFSAHNRFYAKHSSNFDLTIRSLRVTTDKKNFNDDGLLTGKPGEQYGKPEEDYGGHIGRLANEEDTFASMMLSFVKSTFFLGVLLMCLCVGAYFGLAYLKNKSKNKEKLKNQNISEENKKQDEPK